MNCEELFSYRKRVSKLFCEMNQRNSGESPIIIPVAYVSTNLRLCILLLGKKEMDGFNPPRSSSFVSNGKLIFYIIFSELRNHQT